MIPSALHYQLSDPETHWATISVWGDRAPDRGRAFDEAVDECLGSVFAMQLDFDDWLNEKPWEATLDEDTVRVAGRAFPRHDLGTESHTAGTWLWAWASHEYAPDRPCAALSLALRDEGERREMLELTDSVVDLGRGGGVAFATVAAGICKLPFLTSACMPSSPYLLVGMPAGWRSEKLTALRVVRVIGQAVAGGLATDHRRMIVAFLRTQGFNIVEGHASIVGARGDDEVTLTFDERERLATLATAVAPASLAAIPEKPWWRFW